MDKRKQGERRKDGAEGLERDPLPHPLSQSFELLANLEKTRGIT